MNYDFNYENNNNISCINNSGINNNEYRALYPIKYLLKYNIYTKNKTLVYLEKDSNNLVFIEDLNILFTYNLNLDEKIKHFEINAPNSFLVFNKEKNISGQINLYNILLT